MLIRDSMLAKICKLWARSTFPEQPFQEVSYPCLDIHQPCCILKCCRYKPPFDFASWHLQVAGRSRLLTHDHTLSSCYSQHLSDFFFHLLSVSILSLAYASGRFPYAFLAQCCGAPFILVYYDSLNLALLAWCCPFF